MLNLLGEDAGWDKVGRPVTWCLTLAKLPLGSLEAEPTPKGMLVSEANLTLPVLKWFQGKPELSPECSASSLMGPRSSPHSLSSSVSHNCHPERSAPHMFPPYPPMCSSCVLSKAQHGTYILCALQPCPAATSAQGLSWTQKPLTKKPGV